MLRLIPSGELIDGFKACRGNMRKPHYALNSVGLVLTGFMLIGIWGNVSSMDRTRHVPGHGAGFWVAFFVYWLVVAFLVGVGSVMNLARRRLSLWPTIMAISGYSLTILLLPLAIWATVVLVRERKKWRRKSHPNAPSIPITTSKSHSA